MREALSLTWTILATLIRHCDLFLNRTLKLRTNNFITFHCSVYARTIIAPNYCFFSMFKISFINVTISWNFGTLVSLKVSNKEPSYSLKHLEQHSPLCWTGCLHFKGRHSIFLQVTIPFVHRHSLHPIFQTSPSSLTLSFETQDFLQSHFSRFSIRFSTLSTWNWGKLIRICWLESPSFLAPYNLLKGGHFLAEIVNYILKLLELSARGTHGVHIIA